MGQVEAAVSARTPADARRGDTPHSAWKAIVRRGRRFGTGPLGARADEAGGAQGCRARGQGAEDPHGDRLSPDGRRPHPAGGFTLQGCWYSRVPGEQREENPPAHRTPETAGRLGAGG